MNVTDTDACEHVAITGMAARFPGAPNVEMFWRNLRDAVDSISFFESSDLRAAGVTPAALADPCYVPAAAVLEDIESFDAGFFGFSARQAEMLDPQQRVLLEVAWNALADAGHSASGRRRNCGVFVGGSSSSYMRNVLAGEIDPSSGELGLGALIGNDADYLATQIAYRLDLTGPAMAVQTACSTSLVAVHQASQALLNGECDMALAGGVTIRVPHRVGYMQHGGSMLAPDGRCRPFDRDAGGTVPGSGAGVVVLRRLEDALADRDNIRAIIRGSAVGNDGASKVGFTAPSAAGQADVIARALALARLRPDEVSLIEAHGTGTPLGDPIEVEALTQIFHRAGGRERACALGSVKSNVGHLECAAGIAGLIKVVVALQHETIPASLHFTGANPALDLDATPFFVPTHSTPWHASSRPRRAGVSSFGFGGTNCHVVLEQAPQTREVRDELSDAQILLISAKTDGALKDVASSYAGVVAADPEGFADLCSTSALGGSHLPRRRAIVASTVQEIGQALADVCREGQTTGSVECAAKSRRLGFLFTGQGSQWPGMGKELYEAFPTFRSVLDRCAEALSGVLERPLLPMMFGEHGDALNQTVFTQPALYALEVGLCELWRSWGVVPQTVLGHSVGEFAAAYAAGVFELEDGLRLVAARGRCMQELCEDGAMAAVWASREAIDEALEHGGGELWLAAHNGPEQWTIAGSQHSVTAAQELLEGRRARVSRLAVSRAFHSGLMEPSLEQIAAAASKVPHGSPKLSMISNVTGRELGPHELGESYWRNQARATVQFESGLKSLSESGCGLILEVGPSATLCGLGETSLGRQSHAWMPSMQKGRGQRLRLLETLGELYTRGVDVDWEKFHGPSHRRRVPLPSYPFQRKRHWLSAGRVAPTSPTVHSRFLHRWYAPDGSSHFETTFDVSAPGAPSGHRVQGREVFPAAAYVELMRAAGSTVFGAGAWLQDVEFCRPMELIGGQPREIHITVSGTEAPTQVVVHSAPAPGGDAPRFVRHAQALLQPGPARFAAVELSEALASCPREVSVSEMYAALHDLGMQHSGAFAGVASVATGERSALVQVSAMDIEEDYRWACPPPLLDSCLQVFAHHVLHEHPGQLLVPTGIDSVVLRDGARDVRWCHGTIRKDSTANTLVGDATLFDASGTTVGHLEGVCFEAGINAAPTATPRASNAYEIQWKSINLGPLAVGERSWLIFDDGTVGPDFAALAETAGSRCTRVVPGAEYQRCTDGSWSIRPDRPGDFARLLHDVGFDSDCTIIHLWSLLAEPLGESGADTAKLVDEIGLACTALGLLVRSLRLHGAPGSRVVVVTRGAFSVCAEEVRPEQTAIAAMYRTLRIEHPEIHLSSIDLGLRDGGPDLALAASQEAVEVEVAVRDGRGYVPRLAHAGTAPETRQLPPLEPYRLRLRQQGMLETLAFECHDVPDLGPGQLLLRVTASAVNFRDVFSALGELPGRDSTLGHECTGFVVARGTDCAVEIGQRVVAVASGTFASHVVVDEQLTAVVPDALPSTVAASVPLVFMTAHVALNQLARVGPGQRILIHAGAGGVGQAAIQLANLAGAEIFATAGSSAKRAWLRSLGIKYVFDSRSAAFAQQIREVTEGYGLDVVVNSLSGDLIPAGMSLLRPGGLFLELGKAGIWEAQRVRAQFPAINYKVVALDEMMRERPNELGTLLRHVVQRFDVGDWTPTTIQVFPLCDVVTAFRHIQRARHVGKVVLRHPPASEVLTVHDDGTYLITGGAGALGVSLATHLVERGAHKVLLVGRGDATPELAERLSRIEGRGAAEYIPGDCTKPGTVAMIMANIEERGLNLRGIVHAAGVLADQLATEADATEFRKVLAPKVAGAWNLHVASAKYSLDFFIMCSSIASVLPSDGQSSYAAANAFLDGLAQYRLASGLPALSVSWGPWRAGMALRSAPTAERRLLAKGIDFIDPRTGWQLLDSHVTTQPAHVVVASIKWERYLKSVGSQADRLLSHLATAKSPVPSDRSSSPLASILEKPVNRRRDSVFSHVHTLAQRVLSSTGEELSTAEPLRSVGLDSLAAVELRNLLADTLKLQLPSTLLFDYPTLDAVTDYLMVELFGEESDFVREAASRPSREVDVEVAAASAKDLEAEVTAAFESWGTVDE